MSLKCRYCNESVTQSFCDLGMSPLSNANLKQMGLPFFDGKYSDFNSDWYLITGDIIIQTMILNIFTPGIIILINYIRF